MDDYVLGIIIALAFIAVLALSHIPVPRTRARTPSPEEACAPGVDAETAARLTRWLRPQRDARFTVVRRPDGLRYVKPLRADDA